MGENIRYGGQVEKSTDSVENTIEQAEVKKVEFFEYLESTSADIKDAMYRLHDYIEAHYEHDYNKKYGPLVSDLKWLSQEEGVTIGHELTGPDEMLSLYMFIKAKLLKSPTVTSDRKTQMQSLFGRIGNLKSLQSFQLQENNIIKYRGDEAEPGEMFHILSILTHSFLQMSGAHDKQLPIPLEVDSQEFTTFGQLFKYFQDIFYVITSQATKKLIPTLKYEDQSDVKMSNTNVPGQISVGIRAETFEKVVEKCDYKLTENDRKLLSMIGVDTINQGSFAFRIETAKKPVGYQENLDKVLENMSKNIWILNEIDIYEGGTEEFFDTGQQNEYEEVQRELIAHYAEAFDRLNTPWQKLKPIDLTSKKVDPAREEPLIKTSPEYRSYLKDVKPVEQLNNGYLLESYLSKQELIDMKSLKISEHYYEKIDKIITYINENEEKCRDKMSSVASAMHTDPPELPPMRYEYGKMKFKDKRNKKFDTIKFNVNDGHRVKMYFKTEGGPLQVEFENARVYHDTRKG